ncbi:MAG: response regulator transcription factor [Planctomycetes bacterium]|nr:response regulator transcription factor [Planctomycetota bacterium]
MRLLLADDHGIVRSGLRRILEQEFSGVVVFEAANCPDVLNALRSNRFDAIVLDISMAGQNSLNILPEIRQTAPNTPVVVLSVHGERQFVVRALRAGALAYLTKERAPEELFRAIRSVLAGKRYLAQPLAEQLADYVAAENPDAPHEALSPREYEILLLLALAKTPSAIAEQLKLSVKTISTYRTRILEKMGLRSNAELMQYAIGHKLVDLPV